MPVAPKDYSGQVVGMLTARSMIRDERGEIRWQCLCECGREVSVQARELGAAIRREGLTKNGYPLCCGCRAGGAQRVNGSDPAMDSETLKAEFEGLEPEEQDRFVLWAVEAALTRRRALKGGGVNGQ
jgi:hypothetical protein